MFKLIKYSYTFCNTLLLWSCFTFAGISEAAGTDIKIGVLSIRGKATALKEWTPTAEYLSSRVTNHNFLIVPLNLTEMPRAVASSNVDFVITNSGNYIELEAAYGISRIATLKNFRDGYAFTQFGGVIFTRLDRTDLRSIEDLAGKSFMAVDEKAFGGFQMGWRELKNHGIDPHRDFTQLRFSGFPQDGVVFAVQNGEVDAGTVRSGVLEKMAREGKIRINDFHVLNPKWVDGFPLLSSTQLYPEWAFAKVKATSENLSQVVAIALLQMPADSEAATKAKITGWTIPLDYQSVHDLMKELHIGPYVHLGTVTIGQIFRQYRYWIAAIIVTISLLVSIAIMLLNLNKKLSRSKESLEQEIGMRRRAESQLSRFGRIIDQSFDEIYLFDASSLKIVQANQGTLNNLGYTMEELKNMTPFNFHKELTSKEFSAYLDRLQHGEEKLITFETKHYRKDNSSYFVEVRLQLSKSENIPVFMAIAQNIDDRKLAEEELKKHKENLETLVIERTYDLAKARDEAVSANRYKSIFLTNISHELRTPLNAILGYSEILRDESAIRDNSQLLDDVDKIHIAGKHLLTLIDEVLDITKIDSGNVELFIQLVDVYNLVHDMSLTVKPLIAAHNNILQIKCEHDIGTMQVDLTRLKQVLLNLLSNASKFTEHGTISLSASKEYVRNEEWIQFTVTDTGTGISQEKIQLLFEPFAQVDAAVTSHLGGTGLGLSISQRFCRLMKGDITVDSEPGKGSTFTVHLPRSTKNSERQMTSVLESAE